MEPLFFKQISPKFTKSRFQKTHKHRDALKIIKSKQKFAKKMSKQNVASEIIEEFKKKIATIPLNQRLSAIAVYNKLKQYTTSEDILDEKIAVISKEFEGQQWKITTKVDHIISGERKCDEDELKVVEEFLNEGETIKPEDNDGAKMVGFWLKVFENSDIHLKEQDKAILKYLKQIDISSEEKLKEPKQYKYLNLKLIFEENEHFENTELSVKVTYEYLEIPVKSEGTVINWKAGKNITTKPKTAKKGKKDRKKAKNAPSEETILSFFDIFGNFSEISDQEFDPENPEQFNQPC